MDIEKFIDDLIEEYAVLEEDTKKLEEEKKKSNLDFERKNKALIEELNTAKERLETALETLNQTLHTQTLESGQKSYLDGSIRLQKRKSIAWDETDEEELFNFLVENHPNLLTIPKTGTPEFIILLEYIQNVKPELLVVDRKLVSANLKNINFPALVIIEKLTKVSEKIFHRILFNKLDEKRWNEHATKN